MGILDIFSKKKTVQTENNTLFGQQQLGNQIVRIQQKGQQGSAFQLLYVTTASATNAGRVVDMSVLSRNSTVMSCVNVKARALSQCGIDVMYKTDDGTFENALNSKKIGSRDLAKAKQVLNLLQTPNNFQNAYEFWYQWAMWYDLSGECFTLLYRKDQKDPVQTPIEMYNLDSTLITVQMTDLRYPMYRLSTPTYGFNKDWQVTKSCILPRLHGRGRLVSIKVFWQLNWSRWIPILICTLTTSCRMALNRPAFSALTK